MWSLSLKPTEQVLGLCFGILDFSTHQQILSGGLLGMFGAFPFVFHLLLMVSNVFLVGAACKKKRAA